MSDQAEKFLLEGTTAITGIYPGETIVGLKCTGQHSVLRLVKGVIPAAGKAIQTIKDAGMTAQLRKYLELLDFDQQRIEFILNVSGDADLHYTQCDVTFQVVSLGKKTIEKLSPEDVNRLMREPVTVDEFNQMFPRKAGSRAINHTLFFGAHYWKLQHDLTDMMDAPEGACFRAFMMETGEVTTISPPGLKRWKLTNVHEHDLYVFDSIGQEANLAQQHKLLFQFCPGYGQDHLCYFNNVIKGFPPSGFKSLLQKLIRYQPMEVQIGEVKMGAEFVLLATFVTLLNHPGAFVPNIQRYVTGKESAFKRLAVSIVEDSYLDPQYQNWLSIMMLASLTAQRHPDWKPSLAMIQNLMAISINCIRDRRAFTYDWHSELPPFDYDQSLIHPLRLASYLLDDLRSFKTDLWMFRSLDGTYRPMVDVPDRPSFMLLDHCVDQHWAPEIGLYFSYKTVKDRAGKAGEPFQPLYRELFHRVTGVNSRREVIVDDAFTREARRGQDLVLKAKFGSRIQVKSKVLAHTHHVTKLNPAWLAAAVGAVPVGPHGNYLVTIDPSDMSQLHAVVKPSRNMKSALLSDEQEEWAMEQFREKLRTKGVKLNACRSPLEGKTLHLVDEKYLIREGPLSCPVEAALHVSRAIQEVEVKPVSWFHAITHRNPDRDRSWSLPTTSPVVQQRLLYYLNGYRSTITMNKIGLGGDSNGLTVTPEDTGAFHLLCQLAYHRPDLLTMMDRKTTSFAVHSPVELAELVTQIRRQSETQMVGVWPPVQDNLARIPWSHQLTSLGELKARERGNFIWIPVGMGKTWIVLSYLKWLIEGENLPRHVIYSLPDSAISSIIREIQAFGFEVELLHPVQRVSSVSIPVVTTPTPYRITLVEHDHLRLARTELMEVVSDAMVVVDEVHLTLNDSQRTGVALEMARLSRNFIGLTGTPVIDTKIYKLQHWLEQIADYEVTEKNFWVAVNSMIAKRVNTGVIVKRYEVLASFTEEENGYYQSKVSTKHGGNNLYPKPEDYRLAMQVSYRAITREIVNQTLGLVSQGHRCFVVARDQTHAEELYQILGQGLPSRQISLIERGRSVFLTHETTGPDADIRVVITPIRRSTGYTATLMNVMVTGVYPSNNATREQIEGRINRISQQSKEISQIVVHAGIVTQMMLYHKDAKNLSDVLKTMVAEV